MLGGFREEAALSTFIYNWISTDELRGIDIAIQLRDITGMLVFVLYCGAMLCILECYRDEHYFRKGNAEPPVR